MLRRFAAAIFAATLFSVVAFAFAGPASADGHGPNQRSAHSHGHDTGQISTHSSHPSCPSGHASGHSPRHSSDRHATHHGATQVEARTGAHRSSGHHSGHGNSHGWKHGRAHGSSGTHGHGHHPLPVLIKQVEHTVHTIVKHVDHTVHSVAKKVATKVAKKAAPTKAAAPVKHQTHQVTTVRTSTREIGGVQTARAPVVAPALPVATAPSAGTPTHTAPTHAPTSHTPAQPSKPATAPKTTPKPRAIDIAPVGALHSTLALLILGGIALVTLAVMAYVVRIGRRGATNA